MKISNITDEVLERLNEIIKDKFLVLTNKKGYEVFIKPSIEFVDTDFVIRDKVITDLKKHYDLDSNISYSESNIFIYSQDRLTVDYFIVANNITKTYYDTLKINLANEFYKNLYLNHYDTCPESAESLHDFIFKLSKERDRTLNMIHVIEVNNKKINFGINFDNQSIYNFVHNKDNSLNYKIRIQIDDNKITEFNSFNELLNELQEKEVLNETKKSN